jgi:gas vesicle protein
MNEINRGHGNGILLAAVVGAAAGAGIALLFAPCSGRETREWLAHRTREIKDRTQEIKDRTASAFEHVKDATRQAAKEIGRDTEEALAARKRPA